MAGMDLGTARIKVQADTNEAQSKLSSFGNVAKTTMKGVGVSIGVATTAVGALTKASIEQYAQYEQLVGGVETLFKKSSAEVMEYANNAYKTAGLSANEYMETVTSFSASLLQGLGGDTKKASKIADLAITDMADNANKMGTSMESIQNAYQGFAKQNYTMLDNLKLGYGGTKTEMQRLLADAEKLEGKKFDISNFNDIIEAIHVIQKQMGITGTTAEEAMSTIEGSLNMTKSAWTNLITGMANSEADFDQLIDNFVESASAFGDNILPRIEITLKGVGQLIENLLPPIVDRLPKLIEEVLPNLLNAGIKMMESLGNGIIQSLPNLIKCGVDAIKTILNGITSNLPQIINGAMEIVSSLVDGIVQVLPMLLDAGLQLLVALGKGIAENLPTLVPTIVNLVISMCDIIIENLPMLINVAIEIIMALTEGLIEALPTLIAEVPRIINEFSNAIFENLPIVIEAGIKIIAMLIVGLIQSIPTLIANIPQIIMAIVNCFTLYNWGSVGKGLISKVGQGLSSMKGNIGNIARGVAEWVRTSIRNIFSSGGTWGSNLISNIGRGITSMKNSLITTAENLGQSALNGIREKFASATNLGKTLINAIKNGITGAWSGFTSWVKDKASNISLFSLDAPEEGQETSFVSPQNINPMARTSFLDNPSLFGATTRKTNSQLRDNSKKSDKKLNKMIQAIDNMSKILEGGKEVNINVPLSVDGKQIARASAKYMESELNALSNRKARLAGAF